MISFRQVGSGENVLLLHGLFGMGANLKSISRALCPHFSVYSVDLPDHGSSSWLSGRDIRIYAWILNYEGLRRDYPLLSLAPDSAGAQYHRPSLFVRGQKSSFISKESEGSIRKIFPESMILTVAGAGHWVHFDKPDQFNAIALKFLSEVSDIV